jgi:hypothetical protein
MGETKKLNLIVCLPGERFSHGFLHSWTKLLSHLIRKGVNVNVIYAFGSHVGHVRETCVSENPMDGSDKIFVGLDYDYVLWVDSDQVFEPVHFEMLLEADKDVVAAPIKTLPYANYNCGHLDGETIARIKEFKPEDDVVEVDFTGFGFILFKKGVFERMRFPYFAAMKYGGHKGDMGEDFSFCLRAKEAGIKLHVASKCKVLHEKLGCL